MGQEDEKLHGIVEEQLEEILIKTEDFPLPRIELIARDAQQYLQNLKSGLSEDALKVRPTSNDTLINIRANDYFVRNDILSPEVTELMRRSKRIVYMGDESMIGYVHIDHGEFGFGEDDLHEVESDSSVNVNISMILYDVNDEEGEDVLTADDLKTMQELWDQSRRAVRDGDLTDYSQMNRGQIIDRFIKFTEDYI